MGFGFACSGPKWLKEGTKSGHRMFRKDKIKHRVSWVARAEAVLVKAEVGRNDEAAYENLVLGNVCDDTEGAVLRIGAL